ncbi:hypothetical protein [Embleya sp. NPDC005575]|uniref:hypothetical protein n=1 Tax=Embleya sp. NPDC005575 TaxID=3156892 RepID=UPI0033B1DEDC
MLRDSPDTRAARDTVERIRAALHSGPEETRSALVRSLLIPAPALEIGPRFRRPGHAKD